MSERIVVGRVTLVLLLILPQPLYPATITVDETTCTLVDAITAANTDTAVGGCTAGSGADTIDLTTSVSLTVVDNVTYGPNGLPVVTSDITVDEISCTLVEYFVWSDPGGFLGKTQSLFAARSIRETLSGLARLAREHFPAPHPAPPFVRPDGSPLP